MLGPIVGGMFAKAAAGKQMIDEFAPHLEPDPLARYAEDLEIIRRGASGVEAVYAQQGVPAGAFPGIDAYRPQAAEIDERASSLLARIEATEPDYRDVADIGGFDRVPFLIVLAGVVALYGGGVLLKGGRGRAPFAAGVVVAASVALATYPFVSKLPQGARAGEQMLERLEPVMTPAYVRELQNDFVLMVHAVGQLDTAFRAVPQSGQAGADIARLVEAWPRVSSDLAELVGTMNDNIDNFDDMNALPALRTMPWVLVAVGAFIAASAFAALPRRIKETT